MHTPQRAICWLAPLFASPAMQIIVTLVDDVCLVVNFWI